MHILVTGGVGFIGSHTVVECLSAGHSVTILDNLASGQRAALDRIDAICGIRPGFLEVDIRDRQALEVALSGNRFDAVAHFAGLKSISESIQDPLRYYENNVVGTFHLVEALSRHGPKTLVFSSSATVYGNPQRFPILESTETAPQAPYGRTKLQIELMLRDLAASDPEWQITTLRYFNPVGAHPSGLLGEAPAQTATNLMPCIVQVALGRLPWVPVYGNDYPTHDGTGIRDYIHVVDLAMGHLAAIAHLPQQQGLLTLNLGTGRGYSVLQVIKAFETATGQSICYRFAPRRPCDIAISVADPGLAENILGWRAVLDLDAMCRDVWNWQHHN